MDTMEQPTKPDAAYIGDMAMQLAEMARAQGFKLLAYLLEMATVEANSATQTGQQVKH
jgi:hypothetical protein